MDESEGDDRTEDSAAEGRPDNKRSYAKVSRKQIKTLPKLIWDDWQKTFIDTLGDKILCCGRQSGKSEICGADASEWAVNKNNGFAVVMIAPTERQSYALFTKTLNYLANNYPTYIKKGKDRPTKERIQLTNGIDIYCLPVGQSGLGIRFITIGRLYVDEASRVPEDVWEAITPSLLTTGGDTILLSTPFGKQGEFYKCWINQDGAYDSFTRFSITSEDVVRNRPISEVWTEKRRERSLLKLEQAKARFTQKRYAQEYLGEFVDDLFTLFSRQQVLDCCILKRRITPILQGKQYYLGVDVARLGECKSSFQILDKINSETIEQIENITTKKTLTTTTFDIIVQLESRYNFKKIGIDSGSGSLGVGLHDWLMREPTTKKKTVALNNQKRMMDYEGDSNIKLLKEDMYFNLKAMMEKGIIKLLAEDDVIESLLSVQYEYVVKEGQQTKIKIYGNDTDIAEGLIRAAWLANTKVLNSFISYI